MYLEALSNFIGLGKACESLCAFDEGDEAAMKPVSPGSTDDSEDVVSACIHISGCAYINVLCPG
jgi:hypothetical protein